MNLWSSACDFWYGDTSLIYSNTTHKLLFVAQHLQTQYTAKLSAYT